MGTLTDSIYGIELRSDPKTEVKVKLFVSFPKSCLFSFVPEKYFSDDINLTVTLPKYQSP